jgi:hypothetical protein
LPPSPGDRRTRIEQADVPSASVEALRADLAAIDKQVFGRSGGGSLDEQLAALRRVALNILGGDGV